MDRRNYSERDSRDARYYKTDDPPNSRLFIIGHKALNEDDFRNAFAKFGNIEEIWVVKDKRTGDNKGVTYIKFSKTSEAANALEDMNGRTIGDSNRSIKVVVAASRDQGSKRDMNEDEKAQRLFVLVSKTATVSELEDYFKQFGDIDYVNIIKDRDTRESKGYAYVKYHRFSHAADAFENCDRKYKAVFAEPRKNPGGSSSNNNNPAVNAYLDNRYGMRMDYQGMGGFMSGGNRDSSDMGMNSGGGGGAGFSQNSGGWGGNDFGGGGGGITRLRVVASSMVNEDQLWKLFDIIPGLDYCQLVPADQHSGRSIGTVVYSSPEKAAYASEKLHGFEYPPGFRLIVKLDDGGSSDNPNRNSSGRGSSGNGGPNMPHQGDSLNASLAKYSGGSSGSGIPKMSELCSVPLPEVKPLADIDSDVGARCFIVCTPPPPPLPILKDIFCRFGTLIEVYILPNRNCGYARYASKEAAQNAIQTLHGAEIYGGRIKVMEAEERDDPQRKRVKFD